MVPRTNAEARLGLSVVTFDELLPLREEMLEFVVLTLLAAITDHVGYLSTSRSGGELFKRVSAVFTDLLAYLDTH